MVLRAQTDSEFRNVSQELLLNVAEELKLPLLQIARQAEQARQGGGIDLDRLGATASTALGLLDNYTLGMRLTQESRELVLESLSVSSVLYDTGHQLTDYAKSYGVELELNVGGRFATVLAHRQGLQAALVSLGTALIEALPAQESGRLKLQLATHRTRYGIVAGLYSDTRRLGREALQRGRALHRHSRQPLIGLTHTSGAGIFVADTLLRAMRLHLRASRYRGRYGLGTVLQPNYQLQLV